MKNFISLFLLLFISISLFSQDQTFDGNVNVNGSLFIKGDSRDPENNWLQNYLYFGGHYLIIGSKKESYTNNVIKLEPAGSSRGEVFATLEIYRSLDTNNHIRSIRFTAQNGASNYINNGGKFGIGTASPQAALDVRGKIIADEVEIKINSGADFVFGQEYKLPTLSELDDFIKENKHLPEIPSEKQMKEEGVNVNEMQIKLLQKIEELTLYVIEQDKQIKKLEAKLEEYSNDKD